MKRPCAPGSALRNRSRMYGSTVAVTSPWPAAATVTRSPMFVAAASLTTAHTHVACTTPAQLGRPNGRQRAAGMRVQLIVEHQRTFLPWGSPAVGRRTMRFSHHLNYGLRTFYWTR